MKLLLPLAIVLTINTTAHSQCCAKCDTLPYIDLKLHYQLYDKPGSVFAFEMPSMSIGMLKSITRITIPGTDWKIKKFAMVFSRVCYDSTILYSEACAQDDTYSPKMQSEIIRSCVGERVCFHGVIVRNRNGKRYQLYPVNLILE